jgi:hypothetical protein
MRIYLAYTTHPLPLATRLTALAPLATRLTPWPPLAWREGEPANKSLNIFRL